MPDAGLPEAMVELRWELVGRIDELDERIDDRQLRASARANEGTARRIAIPGVRPMTGLAILAFAPPMESFRRGATLRAWLGLVPPQHTRLVAVALADRTARRVWARATKKET